MIDPTAVGTLPPSSGEGKDLCIGWLLDGIQALLILPMDVLPRFVHVRIKVAQIVQHDNGAEARYNLEVSL